MMRNGLLLSALFLFITLASGSVSASFNVTYLSTTVFLTNSTTAHIVEGVQVYVSGSSVSLYNLDRQALNLSLSKWQQVIGSSYLAEHVSNPKGSINNFTFLPGPVIAAGNGTGYASLTISYDANNVANVTSIAPRQFEYMINSSIFSFLHTASGQTLLPNTRLTITVPNGTQIASIYPLPDSPQPTSFGKYTGTSFSWYLGEPLNGFNFAYIVKQTPEQEVLQYFSNIYDNYTTFLYVLIILALAAIGVYAYTKFSR